MKEEGGWKKEEWRRTKEEGRVRKEEGGRPEGEGGGMIYLATPRYEIVAKFATRQPYDAMWQAAQPRFLMGAYQSVS